VDAIHKLYKSKWASPIEALRPTSLRRAFSDPLGLNGLRQLRHFEAPLKKAAVPNGAAALNVKCAVFKF